MSIFGAAKRGLGLLGKLGKKKPVAPKAPSKPKTTKEKHDEFMQLDPFVRRNIISARESAKRGDVYKAGSVMGTPGPHRSAESIKKFWGKGTYQLTDPVRKRKGPGKAEGGRIGLQFGGSKKTPSPHRSGKSGRTLVADLSANDIKLIKWGKKRGQTTTTAIKETVGAGFNKKKPPTDKEIEGVLKGTITKPTGIFAAKGGRIR